MPEIRYKTVAVDGVSIFYREAGQIGAPKFLLLHGFPTSSHMFRELIPQLADRFHVIAPDLPGFGRSSNPLSNTFDSLTTTIDRFTSIVGFERFALYVFDYGAPVGFRIAAQQPDRIVALVSQNGNAYDEGLSENWQPLRDYWALPTEENRSILRSLLAPETTVWQYTHGVIDQTLVSPDGYTLDNYYLSRSGADAVQLDLFVDYEHNISLYPTFQAYFRQHQPRLLAIWGKNDPFFRPEGAEAFKQDLPTARVVLLETGHFALETHADVIAQEIHEFLA